MNFKLTMKDNTQLIKERGIAPYGRTQRFIDQESIRLMDKYTPRISGALIKTSTQGTKIGSGEIVQNAPNARYDYYGKLMVSSVTGSAYARKGESKVLTEKNLEYTTSANPMAGPFWFERMKADHKEKILKGAQHIANKTV